MSTHTVRFPPFSLIPADEKLRPHTPTSRASTPAYHSSPGASTTETDSLDSSWFPIDPVSPANSNSEGSDDDTLSSSIYSIGSDTAHSLTSTESDLQVEEGYVDAEASTTTHTSDTSSQLPLIFPHYDDLENSFASTSDETTPSASVQLQTTSYLSQAPTPVVRGQRSSSYRLSLDKGGDEGKAGSLWGMAVDGGYQGLASDTIGGPEEGAGKLEEKLGDKVEEKIEEEAVTAHEIREGVKTDRLRRALAASTLTNLRGSQKWSSKLSILTLASLLGLVLATVRYSIIPSSSPSSPEVIPTQQVKPFSILDYLPSTSMEAPSSIMPDVRLIKNALSLSTVRPTIKPVQSDPESQSVAKVAGSYSLALRNSEAGLIAFLQSSGSTWQRAKEMVRPSSPPPVVTEIPEGPTYGQIFYSDVKTAWSKTISSYSHTEFIHCIRNQIIATIQMEIQQALLLATYLLEVGKNVTKAATPYFQNGFNRTQGMYNNIKLFGGSINMPTTDIAASAAKAATDSVASKAAMTSQKGREAIQQARQGLEYLIQEAKRRAGPTSQEASKDDVRGAKGRFSGLKNKIRNHKGKAVQNPNRGIKSNSQMKEMREEKGKKMTMTERLMLALHNAAMPLVV